MTPPRQTGPGGSWYSLFIGGYTLFYVADFTYLHASPKTASFLAFSAFYSAKALLFGANTRGGGGC